jgi:hypothetical protein
MTAIELAGRLLPVTSLEEFYLADAARPTSFVSNFGNWLLPPDAAAALGATAAHLEWVHDTGELVLIGAVPETGTSAADVSTGRAVSDQMSTLVPGTGGMPVRVDGGGAAGGVRELFEAQVVPPGTLVAVLGRVEHGPAVHQRLWGWHRHHRDEHGWSWLSERLADLGNAPD